MTQQNLDHNPVTDRSQELSADEIAGILGVTRRSVYRMVERENWKRMEGFRGRVTYQVPMDFIEDYIAMSQKDQRPITDMSATVIGESPMTPLSQSVTSHETSDIKKETLESHDTDRLVTLLLQEKDSHIQELKEKLQAADSILDDLRNKLAKAENRVSRLEGEMATIENERAAWQKAVSSSEQSVNATQAAYLQLQEQFHKLEEQKLPALPTAATSEAPKQIEAKPPGWMFWKKN